MSSITPQNQDRLASRRLPHEAPWEVGAPPGRWNGVRRPYTEGDVARIQGTVRVEHTLRATRRGAALVSAHYAAITSRRSAP